MSKTEQEKTLFRSFLKLHPGFAGEPIREWHHVSEWYEITGKPRPAVPDHDRPDIICATESARLEGVELKVWLNKEQIAEARLRERIEDTISKAIGEQPLNTYRTISRVWLDPIETRMQSGDVEIFRTELLSFIEEVDRQRSQRSIYERESSEDRVDFSSSRILGKYLRRIRFRPRRPADDSEVERQIAISKELPERRWITFSNRSTSYTPQWMLDTLCQLLDRAKQEERYIGLASKAGLDRLHLLVHYDFKAFAYNSSAETPEYRFKDIVKDASIYLNGDAGPFAAMYLLIYLGGDERVYRIV